MKASAAPETFRLTIPSQTRYLNLVTGLAKRASAVAGLDDAGSSKVSIAVDEAVTNVILHAYHCSPERWVEIEFCFAPKALVVHIWHDGVGLAEDEITLPDPSEYMTHPRKGGLGLLLMSRFMDEVHFFESPGRSECRMVKHVD